MGLHHNLANGKFSFRNDLVTVFNDLRQIFDIAPKIYREQSGSLGIVNPRQCVWQLTEPFLFNNQANRVAFETTEESRRVAMANSIDSRVYPTK